MKLPTRATIAAEERAWIREIERRGDLQPEDRLLLVHASRGETLTNSDARDLLNCDSTVARRALVRLTDAGFLERSGRRGGTEYRLMPDLAPPAGLRLSTGEMADVVVAAAREVGQVTNTTVRQRLGVDRSTALSLLSDLVKSGRLVRRGRKRGTHYVVPGQS